MYSLVAAITCYVGEGDIVAIHYLPQECTGALENACLKTELTDKTTRACGPGLIEGCLGDTCTCKSNLCNSGMPMMSSKTTQLAFLLLNFAIAAFLRRMM